FAFAPAPERTSILAVTVFPDRVDRPFLGSAFQQAVTEVLPKPEEEVQLDWDPQYPDRVLHVWLAVSEHQAFATSPAPERTSNLAVTIFPDNVLKLFLGVPEQLA